jgi:hypothetical protein
MYIAQYCNQLEKHAAIAMIKTLKLEYEDDHGGNIIVETDRPVEIYQIQDSIDWALEA